MNKTKIPWCDYTWNPITGCSPASEGCANCYAQAIRKRFNGGDNSIQFHNERLSDPLKVRKPSRIFVCSMGDLFHPDLADLDILAVLGIMPLAREHKFIILTKRPARMLRILKDLKPLPHVWLGITCENQERAVERIPLLLQTPAAVRFVSIEPMLGPVDLHLYLHPKQAFFDALGSVIGNIIKEEIPRVIHPEGPLMDWVICGPETGPNKRPFNEDWARSLRDQCKAAGVPFFYKGGLLDGVKHEEFPL